MDGTDDVVVIGAGHGGGTLAAFLRQAGFTGRVTLIGDESEAPYHRPPLSKAYLSATEATTDPLRPAAFYVDQGIELVLGSTVLAVDHAKHRVRLADGRVVPYHHLVLAPGAEPRRLPVPGGDRPGVHVLRSVADAAALRPQLGQGVRLVVVGAGYIGLEVAASAVSGGADVTVLERTDRVLGRVASPELSRWTAKRHAEYGTRILTSVDVLEIRDGATAAHEVVLADGSVHAADLVLVATGVAPRQELAEQAGAACDDGIVVDERGRTSVPGVWAIGDATRRPVAARGGRARLESIASATEQARCVAADLTGRPQPAPEVPWFWSDQFRDKTKTAGLLCLDTQVVTRGSEADATFGYFHVDDERRVVAVETVNAPALFMAGKKLIGAGSPVRTDLLADDAVPLTEITRSAGRPA